MGAFAAGPAVTSPVAPPTAAFTYTVTTDDFVAAVLDNPVTRKRFVELARKAAWRRGLRTLPITLGLVLLANLFMFDLGLGWSVASTALLGGLFAVVQWSQIEHGIKSRLPAVLAKQALHHLAGRGDKRGLVAETRGLILTDAAGSGRYAWQQVHLTESERHVIVTAHSTSWAIPKRVGQPLAAFVQLARSYGAG